MAAFATAVDIACQVLIWIIVIRALASWFNVGRDNTVVSALYHITEPFLDPLRRILPRVGMFDIAPIAAILVLLLISEVVHILPTP